MPTFDSGHNYDNYFPNVISVSFYKCVYFFNVQNVPSRAVFDHINGSCIKENVQKRLVFQIVLYWIVSDAIAK